MARRNLLHIAEKRSILCDASEQPLEHGIVIPLGAYARCEQCFGLGGQVECVRLRSVIERLDAEPVARSKQSLSRFIPEDERKFPTQMGQALRSVVLVQVNEDLRVGPCTETMPLLLEARAMSLEPVELAVHDNDDAAVFVRNRLSTGVQVYDAKARMCEASAVVPGEPVSLAIRSAVPEGEHSCRETLTLYGIAVRSYSDNPAHQGVLAATRWEFAAHDGNDTADMPLRH